MTKRFLFAVVASVFVGTVGMFGVSRAVTMQETANGAMPAPVSTNAVDNAALVAQLKLMIVQLQAQVATLVKQVAELQLRTAANQQVIPVPSAVPVDPYTYQTVQNQQFGGTGVLSAPGVLKTLKAPKGDIWGLAWDGSAFWVATPYGDLDRVDQNGNVLMSAKVQLKPVSPTDDDALRAQIQALLAQLNVLQSQTPRNETLIQQILVQIQALQQQLAGGSVNRTGVYPGLAWDGANLWISQGNHIAKLDSLGNEIAGFNVPTKEWATGLAWDGSSLWFLDRGAQTLNQMSTAGTVVKSVPISGGWRLLDGLEYGNGMFYATDAASDTLLKLDANGNVLGKYRLSGATSVDLAWDGTSLWVADVDDNVFRNIDLNRLSESTGIVVPPPGIIPPPPPPQGFRKMTVLYPNGGEMFKAGDTITIKWASENIPVGTATYIEVHEPVAGGYYGAAFIGKTTNSGSITWNVPSTLKTGNNYLVSIFACVNDGTVSEKDQCARDRSDASFSVVSGGGNANLPMISLLTPSSGPVGAQVVVHGSGFTPSGNTVHFDNGVIANLSSYDGTAITFPVPADRVPACRYTYPQCLLPAPYNPVTPGAYSVSVSNVNGASNALPFVVVSSSTSILPTSCGDLDGDGVVGGKDVTFLSSYTFTGFPIPSSPSRADINGDGVAPTPADYVALQLYVYSNGPAPKCK